MPFIYFKDEQELYVSKEVAAIIMEFMKRKTAQMTYYDDTGRMHMINLKLIDSIIIEDY